MEPANWLGSEWEAISSAPAAYITTIVIVWITAYVFTRSKLGDEAAAAKERSEHMRQKVKDLEADKTHLVAKLQSHGEDIEIIKRDLAKKPSIQVGSEEPADPKEGDMWVDTSTPYGSLKRNNRSKGD